MIIRAAEPMRERISRLNYDCDSNDHGVAILSPLMGLGYE